MIVTIDFETYWTKEYSLSKMSEVEYILHPLFQVIMCAVKLGDGEQQVHYGSEACAAAFATIDWDNVALLCHNTRFDGAILLWHFGYKPKLYLDTLSMARGVTHIYAKRSSLKAVAEYLGLPAKGDAVFTYRDYRLENFSQVDLQAYTDYCLHDNALCYEIFQRFITAGFPRSELQVIDLLLRMFIEPQTHLDPVVLAENLANVRAAQASALALVSHIAPSVLSSNVLFPKLLEGLGVDVPMKMSHATGKPTYSLARNDPAFKALCEDDTQPAEVQALLAARLSIKSTIEETRSERLLNLSQYDWSALDLGRGWFTVPYRYYGAHTGRVSGDGGVNAANFKRGSLIRKAVIAPDGYRIVHRDSSQIECRTLGWLAYDDRLLGDFRAGVDIYCDFASEFYGQKVTKQDVQRRFVGKTCILGLGYGMSGPKLRTTLLIGNGGISVKLADDNAAWRLVNYYRSRHSPVAGVWTMAEAMLSSMCTDMMPRSMRRMEITNWPRALRAVDPQGEAVILPNGMALQYPDLRVDLSTGRPQWVYDTPTGQRHIYGAKLVENICQALARIIVTDIMVNVYARTGYRPFMTTYDSHDYVVPEGYAEEFDGILAEEFAKPPMWCSELPLASEGGWGRNLLEAEWRVNQ